MGSYKFIQHLVYEDVRKAALEYFEAGMLTAQCSPEDARCVNKGANHTRCAVAAGFNIALLTKRPVGSISDIIRDGYATCDNHVAIQMLQKLHDDWATHVATGREEEAYKAKEQFRAFLNFTET